MEVPPVSKVGARRDGEGMLPMQGRGGLQMSDDEEWDFMAYDDDFDEENDFIVDRDLGDENDFEIDYLDDPWVIWDDDEEDE